MEKVSAKVTSRTAPDKITDPDYMFPAFSNGKVLRPDYRDN